VTAVTARQFEPPNHAHLVRPRPFHSLLDHDSRVQDLAQHLCEQTLAHGWLDKDHSVGCDWYQHGKPRSLTGQIIFEQLQQPIRDFQLGEPKLVRPLELFHPAQARREADIVRDHHARVQTLEIQHEDGVGVVLAFRLRDERDSERGVLQPDLLLRG